MQNRRRAFQRLGIIIILLISSLVIYCEKDKTLTEPAITRKITGYVAQRYSNFVDPIVGAEVKLDGFTDTSDQNGRYEISGMPEGLYQLVSTHPQYDNFKTVIDYTGELMVYDINMTGPLYSVSGNISNAIDGNLSNTVIWIGNKVDTTDSNGNYKIDSIPQGSKTIYCQHHRYFVDSASLNISGEVTDLDFQLERALYNINGYVTHELDGPIQGAELYIEYRTAITNDSGYYSVSDLPQGAMTIKCNHFRYHSDSTSITISDHHVCQDFQLERALYNINGYVTHELDGPIQGAELLIENKNTITNDSGYYSVSDLPQGAMTIKCNHFRYHSDSTSITISDHHVCQDFQLERALYNINGYVTHELDGPIQGAELLIENKNTITNDSGYYLLQDIPQGLGVLICSHSRYFTDSSNINISTNHLQRDFQLGRDAYTITGTVSHHIDGPITDAIVTIGSGVDTTDHSGYYNFPDNAYGYQSINCLHSDYNPFTNMVSISGVSQQYDIALWQTVAETLQVTEDATVAYLDDWDLGWYHDTTKLIDSNYGDNSRLFLYGDYMTEWIASEPMDYWSDYRLVRRFFINVPSIPNSYPISQLDSVSFAIKMLSRGFGLDCCMNIRRALEPWFEDSITWNSMPALSNIQDSLIFPDIGLSWMMINLTKNYLGYFGTHYGLAINYSHDWEIWPIYYDGSYSFGSSEAENPDDRPVVIFYYSN